MNTRQQAELEAHRASLCAKPDAIYIANPDFHNRVDWFETQSSHILARRCDVLEYERRYLEHALTPKASQNPPAPPPASLTAIVQLDKRFRNFMSADSGWTPRSGIPLADIRPSAFARPPPGTPELAREFEVGYNNIVNAMTACPSSEETAVLRPSGVIDPKKPEGFGFKVGHRVFARRGPDDEDDGVISNWPMGPHAAPELEKIKLTHRAIPIPAFNVVGQAIPPEDYATELRGATVSLTFHLKHWVIRKKHVFTADIESMKVLVPAPPPAAKKKVEPTRGPIVRRVGENAGPSRRKVVITID